MEFKFNVIKNINQGKVFLIGKDYKIEDIEINILNILNAKRAIVFFKKIGKEWVRSNFFEYKSYLEKEEKNKKEKKRKKEKE